MDKRERKAIDKRFPKRAFLYTPFVTTFLVGVWIFYIKTPPEGSQNYLDRLGNLFAMTVFGGFWLALIMLIFAFPVYWILRKLKIENALVTVPSAGLIAAFFYTLPSLFAHGENTSFSFSYADCQVIINGARTECGWKYFWSGLTSNFIYGLIGGLVFWRFYAGKWTWAL